MKIGDLITLEDGSRYTIVDVKVNDYSEYEELGYIEIVVKLNMPVDSIPLEITL